MCKIYIWFYSPAALSRRDIVWKELPLTKYFITHATTIAASNLSQWNSFCSCPSSTWFQLWQSHKFGPLSSPILWLHLPLSTSESPHSAGTQGGAWEQRNLCWFFYSHSLGPWRHVGTRKVEISTPSWAALFSTLHTVEEACRLVLAGEPLCLTNMHRGVVSLGVRGTGSCSGWPGTIT